MMIKDDVIRSLKGYDKIGEGAFRDKYGVSSISRSRFIIFNNKTYPMKLIWAASQNPPTRPRDKSSDQIKGELRRLGFNFLSNSEAEAYQEGKRMMAEIRRISRNRGLVDAAKKKYKLDCMVCGFKFPQFYPGIGDDYIECHHLDELGNNETVSVVTTIDRVCVVCSNCHRMLHKKSPAYSVEELKKIIGND